MLETKIEEPLQVAFPLPAGLFQQLEPYGDPRFNACLARMGLSADARSVR
jgi:hypothetical protein